MIQFIKNLKDFTREIFIPKSEFVDNVVCDIDEEVVDCEQLKDPEPPYLGVPAPAYLPFDPWFGEPVISQRGLDVIEKEHQQAVIDQQLVDESPVKESADIHQKLYEMATQNWTTVAETLGGSENFQENSSGIDGWHSGTGYNQFRAA